jgi:hypothetical protein
VCGVAARRPSSSLAFAETMCCRRRRVWRRCHESSFDRVTNESLFAALPSSGMPPSNLTEAAPLSASLARRSAPHDRCRHYPCDAALIYHPRRARRRPSLHTVTPPFYHSHAASTTASRCSPSRLRRFRASVQTPLRTFSCAPPWRWQPAGSSSRPSWTIFYSWFYSHRFRLPATKYTPSLEMVHRQSA